MKITTYQHVWTPGFCGMTTSILPKCTDHYKEINLMPNQIESWNKIKESYCHCGNDKYKGMYHIITKSGQHYTIVEYPLTLMRNKK